MVSEVNMVSILASGVVAFRGGGCRFPRFCQGGTVPAGESGPGAASCPGALPGRSTPPPRRSAGGREKGRVYPPQRWGRWEPRGGSTGRPGGSCGSAPEAPRAPPCREQRRPLPAPRPHGTPPPPGRAAVPRASRGGAAPAHRARGAAPRPAWAGAQRELRRGFPGKRERGVNG